MMRLFLISLSIIFCSQAPAEAPKEILEDSQTILFLGDSITQRGHYITYFEGWLVDEFPDKRFTVINAGLASETVSGLSEAGHAQGQFPRPCLFERLERVLAKTKPDLIIACYGMNCGIKQELDEERFALFRHGIERLRAAAKQYGAEVIHVTPPIYDNHGKDGFDYDTVLTAYSDWLVQQREHSWYVADLHSEMRTKIDFQKEIQPGFTVQKDRVHPDEAGHWIMAQSLINYFGDPEAAALASPNALIDKVKLEAISERMKSYQRAIHAETKPLRPKVPQGGTMESAAEEANILEDIIYRAHGPAGQK